LKTIKPSSSIKEALKYHIVKAKAHIKRKDLKEAKRILKSKGKDFA